jgi:uncharacterized membrane protein
MATEIERAIIELQVVYRGIHQRLSALERLQGGGAAASPQTRRGLSAPNEGSPPTPPSAPQAVQAESAPRPVPEQQPRPEPQRAAEPHRPPETQPAPEPQRAPEPTVTPESRYASRPGATDLPPLTPLTPEGSTAGSPGSPEYGNRIQSVLQQIADRNHSIDASIENIIGQSVLAYVGGLVLFGAILLFLRFTFVQPWLQPENRVYISMIVGGVMLAAGQYFYHSRMRPLAAAITAIGLATFMAAIFAANMMYTPEVLRRGPAFACMVIVGAAGVGLAFQLRMQSLAVLGLLGMYLAPLLLKVPKADPNPLWVYLSCVTLAGLAICFYRRRWLWLRGVAVMALAVPLYFDGLSTSFAWMTLCVALGVYGVLTGSVLARNVVVAVLALLSLHVMAVNSTDPMLRDGGVSLPNLVVTPWMMIAGMTALLAMFMAWLASKDPVVKVRGYVRPIGAALACIAIGTVLWYALTLFFLKDLQLITLASLAWIFGLLGLGRLLLNNDDAPMIETSITVLIGATCAKWMLFDLGIGMPGNPFGHMTLPGTDVILPPVANLFVLNGVLIILAFRSTRILRELGPQFFGWLITALAFFASNVELVRIVDLTLAAQASNADAWLVKNICVSIFSALFALGIIVVGFTRHYPPARWVALVLFAATVVKVLVVDMAKVDNSLRILSFTVIGLLLLIVSFMYHKTEPPLETNVA